MYCERCGTEILNGENYCYNCGAPAPTPISTQPVGNKNNQSPLQQSPVSSQPIVNASSEPTYVGLAYASFYVSLASLMWCWVPILDVFLEIAAAVVTIVAFTKIKKMKHYSWMPWTAWAFNIITLIVNIFTIL